ncbi:MBL fold metallo-hydrolase [Brachybacterium sp. 107]|uniref:MBL fold metallo-hydrolase n=1 Tax=Brachybacterium sp. 107 TaxID=3457736 RepID=UPI0040334F03
MQIHAIADDVFMVSGIASNWTLVREGRDLTLIDAGYPKDLGAVIAAVEHIGNRVEDIRGALITHAHVDHVGALPQLQEIHRFPLHAHEHELPMLRGEAHEQATAADVLPQCWRPRTALWTLTLLRAGALSSIRLPQTQAVRTGTALDLPGAPVALACPGHTSGHTIYHLPRAGVVLTGDALITGHPVTSRVGPQLLPALTAHDPVGLYDTLGSIAQIDADTLVPGHGPVWRGRMRAAVAEARASAAPVFTRPRP